MVIKFYEVKEYDGQSYKREMTTTLEVSRHDEGATFTIEDADDMQTILSINISNEELPNLIRYLQNGTV